MGRFHLSTYIQVNALIVSVGLVSYLLAYDTIQRVKHTTTHSGVDVSEDAQNDSNTGTYLNVSIWDMLVLHAGVVLRNAVILLALTFLTRNKPVIVPPPRNQTAKRMKKLSSVSSRMASASVNSAQSVEELIDKSTIKNRASCTESVCAIEKSDSIPVQKSADGLPGAGGEEEGHDKYQTAEAIDSSPHACIQRKAIPGPSTTDYQSHTHITTTNVLDSADIHGSDDSTYPVARGSMQKSAPHPGETDIGQGASSVSKFMEDRSQAIPPKTVLGTKTSGPGEHFDIKTYFSGENREMIMRMVFIAGISEIFSLAYQLPRTADVTSHALNALTDGWQDMTRHCIRTQNDTQSYAIMSGLMTNTALPLNQSEDAYAMDTGGPCTVAYMGLESNPYPTLHLAFTFTTLLLSTWLVFTFKMLWFELIFDLCHYWAHRLFHSYMWLYRTFHKLHHRHLHPSPLTTYMQGCGDVLLSNTLPFCLALSVSPVFSEVELYVLLSYKTFVEVAGHTGKVSRASSFPAMPPLVNVLGIDLHTEDHDLHHTHFNYNFSKRFVLWDKIFGTYYYTDSLEKRGS